MGVVCSFPLSQVSHVQSVVYKQLVDDTWSVIIYRLGSNVSHINRRLLSMDLICPILFSYYVTKYTYVLSFVIPTRGFYLVRSLRSRKVRERTNRKQRRRERRSLSNRVSRFVETVCRPTVVKASE